MIYYRFFDDLFPELILKEPEKLLFETPSLNQKEVGRLVVFFPKHYNITPSINTEDYRKFFKEVDTKMLKDLDKYDIYIVPNMVNKENIDKVIYDILERA